MDSIVTEYQRRIKAIYEKQSPKRFSSIETLLAKWKGREQEFYEKVCQKYGVAMLPPPIVNHQNIQHVKVFCRFRPANAMEKKKEVEFLFKKTFNLNQKEYDEFRHVLDTTLKTGIVKFPLTKRTTFNKQLQYCNTEDCCLWLDHNGLGQHKRFFRTKNVTGAWLINPPLYAEKRALEINSKEVINFLRNNQNHRFELDGVIDQSGDQDDVFKMVGQDLVNSVVGGYNATVFAYGQTGTGKTHTMFSPNGGHACMNDRERGLVPRTITEIMQCLRTSDLVRGFELNLAIIEIYREELVDLLSPGVKLQLRYLGQDSSVDNLSWKKVRTTAEALGLIQDANSRRQTAAHCANDTSSRSHVIITLKLKATMENGNVQTSRLNFADLAGSERVIKTMVKGKHLLEAKNILKSLFALQNVIRALSAKKPFIPYQGGMLTKLLRDSLGGNSRTSIIITASPHEYNRAETVATLQFGEQAKKIANQPKCNRVLSRGEMEAQLSAMEEELQYFKRLNSTKTDRNRRSSAPRQHQQAVVCQHAEPRHSAPNVHQGCYQRYRGTEFSFCNPVNKTHQASAIPNKRVVFTKKVNEKDVKKITRRMRKVWRKDRRQEKKMVVLEKKEPSAEEEENCCKYENKCAPSVWGGRRTSTWDRVGVVAKTTRISVLPSIFSKETDQQNQIRDLKEENSLLQQKVHNLSKELSLATSEKKQDNKKMETLKAEISRLKCEVHAMKSHESLPVPTPSLCSSPRSIRPSYQTGPNRRYFML